MKRKPRVSRKRRTENPGFRDILYGLACYRLGDAALESVWPLCDRVCDEMPILPNTQMAIEDIAFWGMRNGDLVGVVKLLAGLGQSMAHLAEFVLDAINNQTTTQPSLDFVDDLSEIISRRLNSVSESELPRIVQHLTSDNPTIASAMGAAIEMCCPGINAYIGTAYSIKDLTRGEIQPGARVTLDRLGEGVERLEDQSVLSNLEEHIRNLESVVQLSPAVAMNVCRHVIEHSPDEVAVMWGILILAVASLVGRTDSTDANDRTTDHAHAIRAIRHSLHASTRTHSQAVQNVARAAISMLADSHTRALRATRFAQITLRGGQVISACGPAADCLNSWWTMASLYRESAARGISDAEFADLIVDFLEHHAGTARVMASAHRVLQTTNIWTASCSNFWAKVYRNWLASKMRTKHFWLDLGRIPVQSPSSELPDHRNERVVSERLRPEINLLDLLASSEAAREARIIQLAAELDWPLEQVVDRLRNGHENSVRCGGVLSTAERCAWLLKSFGFPRRLICDVTGLSNQQQDQLAKLANGSRTRNNRRRQRS